MSNEMLLFAYGFAQFNNPYDSVALSLKTEVNHPSIRFIFLQKSPLIVHAMQVKYSM
jgi:hypothetical protein